MDYVGLLANLSQTCVRILGFGILLESSLHVALMGVNRHLEKQVP